jgi:hypothetical protein
LILLVPQERTSLSAFIKRGNSSDDAPRFRLKTKYHFRPLGWTGHLSLVTVLAHIHAEFGRNNLELSKLREENYWSIMHEIESLIGSDWKYSLASIVDPRDWYIDRLLDNPTEWQPDFLNDVKRIRKPAIEITAFVTIKNNLSIVWHPKTADHSRRGIYKLGDWARWPGEGTYGWSRPHNELVFIKNIDRLRPGQITYRREPELCNWDVLDELFISLIKAAYDWLYETLSSTVQV